jgi:hypothetical protein
MSTLSSSIAQAAGFRGSLSASSCAPSACGEELKSDQAPQLLLECSTHTVSASDRPRPGALSGRHPKAANRHTLEQI